MSRYPSNWESVAHKIRKRDRYRCVKCGRNDLPLHVDHIWPLSKGGPNFMWNLRTLCESCHVRRHPNMSMDPYWQQTLYMHETNSAERLRWQQHWQRRKFFRGAKLVLKVAVILALIPVMAVVIIVGQTGKSRGRGRRYRTRAWTWGRTTRFRKRQKRGRWRRGNESY